MFFVGRKTTAQLQLTTPLDRCCNCGKQGEIELVETPLQKTRYFLFFGTELELLETFPYCRRCRRSAKRIRLGWGSKFLVTCMTMAACFLVLVLVPHALPRAMQSNLFGSALVLGALLTAAYFYLTERRGSERTYHQPVSLVNAEVDDSRLHSLRLRFANADYARIFCKANADLINARVLSVETA
jgi:hypothetical protein